MIITLVGADFSENNIGTLSTWIISRVLGDGANYSGPAFVDKGATLSATVTLDDGYEIGSDGVTVTMGGNPVSSGVTIDGTTVTIEIGAVTGSVVIRVPTKNILIVEPEYYTITYNYVDSDGETIKAATTERVDAGTNMTFSTSNAPAVDGYTVSSVSPTSATINSDITVTYIYANTSSVAISNGTFNIVTSESKYGEKMTPTNNSQRLRIGDTPVEVPAGSTCTFNMTKDNSGKGYVCAVLWWNSDTTLNKNTVVGCTMVESDRSMITGTVDSRNDSLYGKYFMYVLNTSTPLIFNNTTEQTLYVGMSGCSGESGTTVMNPSDFTVTATIQ